MPFPTLLFLEFGIGIAAAMAAAEELRLSLRPILLTGGFTIFLGYLGLVFVPISVYFYAFHGDWFLLYLLDVQRIPSAIALVGFLLEAGIGVMGFLVGAWLARSQYMSTGRVLIGLSVIAGLTVFLICPHRLQAIGSYAQYHGQFGLQRFFSSNLLKGSLSMGGILIAATIFLIFRLRYLGRSRYG